MTAARILCSPRGLAGEAQKALPEVACASGLVQVMAQAFDRVGIIGCSFVQHIEPDEHKVPKQPIGLCITSCAAVITEDVSDAL